MPEEPESEYAREGTIAHAVAEYCLTSGAGASNLVKRALLDEYPGVKIDAETAEAVQIYIDECNEVSEYASIIWIEQSFNLVELDAEFFGTLDFAAYVPSEKTLYVRDYKHGAGVPVAVEGNVQLKYYALAALMLMDQPIERISVGIVQPRTAGSPVKCVTYTPADLEAFGDELAAAAEETRKADAGFKAGTHCRWCRARAVCSEIYDEAQRVAGDEFGDVDLDEATAEIPNLSPAEIGARLSRIETLKLYAKALEAYAFGQATKGNIADGYKVVSTNAGHRKWADGRVLIQEATELYGFDKSELTGTSLLSPAQLQKSLGEEFHIFEKFIAPRKKGFALVPASDKREAVNPADADFGDISLDE